ncbi:MAG: hypothetical protein ABIS50_25400 [Luteolibacter sp.]|uniref:hypothetical protein n=1 Tax=Luteolibacter sp. TaxID=1962973 RepID=UPI003265D9A7
MKKFLPLVAVLLCNFANAYEISGAKPIDKLASEQAKVKDSKKLLCIVYKGADDSCPHCAAAAENGVKAVRGSAECVVITEAQVKDKAVMDKLPSNVQKMLKEQPTNAWVSFTVYDADLTKVIAASSRESLETDKKATKQFSETVHAAKTALK